MPTIPDDNLPKPSQVDDLERVFSFARAVAQQEIEGIDRIHKRTILSLQTVVGALVLATAGLGWLGFSNLKSLAVSTAKQQMQDEVKKQVGENLTPAQVQATVRGALSQGTVSQLQGMVTEQVGAQVHTQMIGQRPEIERLVKADTAQAVKLLAPSISNVAEDETKRIVASSVGLEHFTPTQQEALIKELSKHDPGEILIQGEGTSLSNSLYVSAFKNALDSAHWLTAVSYSRLGGGLYGGNPYEEHLTLEVENVDLLPPSIKALLDALRSIGFDKVRIAPKDKTALAPLSSVLGGPNYSYKQTYANDIASGLMVATPKSDAPNLVVHF